MPMRSRVNVKFKFLLNRAGFFLEQWRMPIFFGHLPKNCQKPAWIICPYSSTTFRCGLSGLIRIERPLSQTPALDLNVAEEALAQFRSFALDRCLKSERTPSQCYLVDDAHLQRLLKWVRDLKQQGQYALLFKDLETQRHLLGISDALSQLLTTEVQTFQQALAGLSPQDGEIIDGRIEMLKDIVWSLKVELLSNIGKVRHLIGENGTAPTDQAVIVFRNLNAVLNSIDRLEVRGRDSAGFSLLFIFDPETFSTIEEQLKKKETADILTPRVDRPILDNGAVCIHKNMDTDLFAVTLTYKVAAEIGSLGDNVTALRSFITEDPILHLITRYSHRFHTVSAHTRWASVGAITIANCHPVDNAVADEPGSKKGIIHACLNGDIDNYADLKKQWESQYPPIAGDITTDTKIIPLQIESYIRKGHSVEKAFRSAVNDFHGSHAIAMHTDLAPGKFFLAQKGSGQAVFIGLTEDHYLPTSEVYGFVEETQRFMKMNGEQIVDGVDGPTQGQIFILDQTAACGPDGIQAMYYDGSPIKISEKDIQTTAITSRDIDRQNFPHYFLKEISEAPLSVAKTLQNRWKIAKDDPLNQSIEMDEAAFPAVIADALAQNKIQRIFFIGQGTAGIAAQVGADILNYYLDEPSLKIGALKASELSGFQLGAEEDKGLADTLVIAISQSGTTTDTNRTVDMVRARGAKTLAVVNRRDSDLTFKVQGVVYTSSGRDIEMSVASTKAFYSQIVACALVGLKIAQLRKRRSAAFITDEIKTLTALPDQMHQVLALKETIQGIAETYAPKKTYWASVGSGPNKAAADEIRIKLSELCYKTISSDYVEDKKHIDLSSEPLIIVCAAGTGGTVINDIVKDTAIFKAHKAVPIVIADEDENRFTDHAAAVIHVPMVRSHLAPIINTLAGHLWGYYAALAINNGSVFLHRFREDLNQTINQYARQGLDVYEIILEKDFREKIAGFYAELRHRLTTAKLPTTINHSADLLLLLKYLAGRLPVNDFELDFGKKGTALNMLNSLFEFLGEAINGMSRPVDAIKHQAKTVTVGTSRITTKIEGILFETLSSHAISTSQLTNNNIMVLKNLQGVVAEIFGAILYKIDGLNLLGELTDRTRIQIIEKRGVLKNIPSRVETDFALKGTKRIVVRQGNVYIGKGRKDDRSIILIPVISAGSNRIEFLLLLNIGFLEDIPLKSKIKALGGKFEHIKNIVQENSLVWEDDLLERVPMDDLFGRSAEKVGEQIVNLVNQA